MFENEHTFGLFNLNVCMMRLDNSFCFPVFALLKEMWPKKCSLERLWKRKLRILKRHLVVFLSSETHPVPFARKLMSQWRRFIA